MLQRPRQIRLAPGTYPGGEIGFEASSSKQALACGIEPHIAARSFLTPTRFAPEDGSEAAPVRAIELHSGRVIMVRTLPGITMTVTLRLQCFLGVAIHMQAPTDSQPGRAAVVLEHADPQLSVTLTHVSEVRDLAWEWRGWAQTLGLPLLVTQVDGSLRELLPRIGGIQTGGAASRRGGRSFLKSRRGVQRLRRRTGSLVSARMHRGEREIIARN